MLKIISLTIWTDPGHADMPYWIETIKTNEGVQKHPFRTATEAISFALELTEVVTRPPSVVYGQFGIQLFWDVATKES